MIVVDETLKECIRAERACAYLVTEERRRHLDRARVGWRRRERTGRAVGVLVRHTVNWQPECCHYVQCPPCSPQTLPVLLQVLQVSFPKMPLARPPLHA